MNLLHNLVEQNLSECYILYSKYDPYNGIKWLKNATKILENPGKMVYKSSEYAAARHYHLATSNLQFGKYDKALSNFAMVCEYANYVDIYVQLSYAYELMKDYYNAAIMYKQKVNLTELIDQIESGIFIISTICMKPDNLNQQKIISIIIEYCTGHVHCFSTHERSERTLQDTGLLSTDSSFSWSEISESGALELETMDV